MKKIFFRIRTDILVLLTHKIALPLLKIVRRPTQINYSLKQLEAFPGGSLGKDLYNFLETRKLPLLPHYARHDLKHVLLNYDTTDKGEACLQSFMLGNGRISFPVLATVLYAVVTMPEYWKTMRLAYYKGKKSASIHNWPWHKLLNQQTAHLRHKIFTN